MLKVNRFVARTSLIAVLPLCFFLAASCSKSGDTPADTGTPDAGTGPGGPGMRGGGPGGMRNAPVAASATGADIYQAKCRCHGPDGKGGNGPSLARSASKPDADLYKTIAEGHQRMPAFSKQLTEEQINKVVAHIKKFGSAS